MSLSSNDKPMSVARSIPASFDATNRIPRRVPVPNLRPPLALCKPTGVTLGAGRRVIIMPDKSGVADVLAKRLRTMGAEVLRIEDKPDAGELANCLKGWIAAGPVHGVYWLPALDNEGDLGNMDLATWHEALRVRVKLLYTTMRILYEQIAASVTFLVSATRLGGQHGYDEAGATAPLGGAVVGFTKTYKRERADAMVKAVDFEVEPKPSEVADILIEETLRDPGAVEIGYKEGLRWTVGLQEQPAADGKPALTLDSNTVFLVTGAAGSIVSAITADLATASGGTFYLLDLVPEPDPQNPDFKRFVTDKDGLKRDLFARIQSRGERATPALVEKELAALERAQAAYSAIAAVRAAGGIAHYFSVNLTDADAVAKIIDQVRERSGRIDVLLHAAGTERSHFLPDKDAREFDLVFDVKSDGWFNLLHAIGDMPLGATVAFSSIAGALRQRRTNRLQLGQRTAGQDHIELPHDPSRNTRHRHRLDGVGRYRNGHTRFHPQNDGTGRNRYVATGSRDSSDSPRAHNRRYTWRDCRRSASRRSAERLGRHRGTGFFSVSSVAGITGARTDDRQTARMSLRRGLTIECTLDPAVQPFLHDHQIGGTPVLPGVMGIEAFAEAALFLLPGWHVAAIEDVNFLTPFKFYRHEPRTISVEAAIYPQPDCLLADCRLTGRRSLPNQIEPQVTTHFTARVRLTKQMLKAVTVPALGLPEGHIIEAADIYRLYFHGPAYQVLERAWRDGDRMVGRMNERLPNNHFPAEKLTLMVPRLIELCFQTAGLWEMDTLGRMGLPQHIRQVSLLRTPDPGVGGLYAVVTPKPDQETFEADIVDAVGNHYLQLTGYSTIALPDLVDSEPLKALHAIAV